MSDVNESRAEKYHDAAKVCEQIEFAAKLMKSARGLLALAQQQSSSAIAETFRGDQLFEVLIPEGAQSTVIVNGDVAELAHSSFVATELRSIGQHGVEFYNHSLGSELHLKGYDFEIVPFDSPQE